MSDTPKLVPTEQPLEEPHLNGKAAANPAKTEIILSAEDKQALLQLNDQALQLRNLFSESSLAVYQLEQAHTDAQVKCLQAYKNLEEAGKALQQRLAEIAIAEGINPKVEKWNFNFEDMTFKRIG